MTAPPVPGRLGAATAVLAHDFHDPGSREPAVIYWFKLTRHDGKVEYVPHRIDDNSGVGRQLVTGDLNKDGLLDFVIGNKNGAFVFLQQSRSVSQAEWNSAQFAGWNPLPLFASLSHRIQCRKSQWFSLVVRRRDSRCRREPRPGRARWSEGSPTDKPRKQG